MENFYIKYFEDPLPITYKQDDIRLIDMAQDTVIKGTDEPVTFVFDFSSSTEFATGGLDNFTEITLSLCSEEYSTVSTPSNLFTEDANTLVLAIGMDTTLPEGSYTPIIIGYNGQNYTDGKVLNSTSKNIIGKPIKVCE